MRIVFHLKNHEYSQLHTYNHRFMVRTMVSCGRARIDQTSDAIKRHFNRNIKSDIKVTAVLQLYYSFANAMVYPQVYVVPEVKDDILRQGNFCQFEELFILI